MIDRIGQQLGRYRLVRLLGQGGFADVYLGEHIYLNTQAAIKVLRTQLSEQDSANFLHEARTIAHLVHPNIVQVLDFGVEYSTPFLVMAYASNGTLRQHHMRGQSLSLELVISYTKQIAAALQYAHDQKIIHRDIKPENMLVGRNMELLLGDFGIALPTASMREPGPGGSLRAADQNSWNPVGTVTYMAPEQIQGRPVPASDQYALAVVVYEWICGMAPFRGSFMEVAMQKMSTAVAPLRSRRPDLPSDVEAVVLTALSIDTQRRFKSVQAFANALTQAVLPPVSSPVTPARSLPPLEASFLGNDGKRIALKGETITIGRRSSCQVVLKDDPKVSARHAELRLVGKGYCLVDLDSTNGTKINGEKIVPQMLRSLKAGDRIAIGDMRFTYEVVGAELEEPVSDGSTVRASESNEDEAVRLARQTPPPQRVVGSEPEHAFYPPLPAALPPAMPGPASVPPFPAFNQAGIGPAKIVADQSSTPLPAQPAVGYSPASTPPLAQPAVGYGPASTPPLAQPPAGGGYSPTPSHFDNVQPGQFSVGPANNAFPGQEGYRSPSNPFYASVTPFIPAGPVSLSGQQNSLPGIPASQSVRPPVHSSRGRLWTLVAVILVVLLVGGSIGFFVYHDSLPTPAKALTNFCGNVLSKNATGAYSELTPRFRNTVSAPLFASFFQGVSACTPGSIAQNGNSATATIALSSSVRTATDPVKLTQQSNGSWQVDDEQVLSALVQTLNGFCAAMQRGDYVTAYEQFTTAFQQKMSSDQFILSFPQPSTCTYSGLTMTKAGGQITVVEVASGLTDNNGTTLLLVDNAWKIDDFTNLPVKTLAAFCVDLQNSSYDSAYGLLSSGYQGSIGGSAAFTQTFSNFSSCSYNPLTLINGQVTSDMSFAMRGASNVPMTGYLVRDPANAKWKIDNLVNFPDRTLNVFCTDLAKRDYQGAYDQLTPNTQASFSESSFVTSFSDVTKCVHTFPSQSGTQATSAMTFTRTDNSTVKRTATLTQVGSQDWKIQSIN